MYAVGRAELAFLHQVGDRRPHDGRYQRERDTHHRHRHQQRYVRVGHHQVDRHQDDRAKHHEQRALAQLVAHQAEDRRCDHSGQRQNAIELAGYFAGQIPCLDEIFD